MDIEATSVDVALHERAAVHAALGEPHRLAVVEALSLSDRSPTELARMLDVGSNLLAHHLDVLEEAGVIARAASHGDGRRTYVRLRAETLEGLAVPVSLRAGQVLFVCTRNSARSQLATAIWNARSPIPAESAGPDPADAVHPRAVDVAQDLGLDLSGARPRGYDDVTAQPDLVVSVCDLAAEDEPPFDSPRLHWSMADPVQDGSMVAFRRTADELQERIERLAPAVRAA